MNAETARYQGDLETAEREYLRLLPDAPNRDKRRWLQVNLGALAGERGDSTLARERLRKVVDEDVRDEHGAKAAYEIAKLGPPDDIELRLAVIRRYPNQVAAEFALGDIISTQRANQHFEELADLLEELCESLADSELGDNVWFELAMLRQTELADPNGALQSYRELFIRYEKGPLADDALWEMSNIYRENQMWRPALRLMEKLATETESSWFVGSYDSDWVDDALYDLGWVTLVHLSDYERATYWFQRYLKAFPHGMLADDAAWHLVEARRLSGDERGYLAALERFAVDYPESRYVRQVRDRLGSTP